MTLIGLAARNMFRNKFRAILTIFGVAVAILTFVFLRTVISAWTSAAEFAAKDRVVTRHKVTFVMTLPRRYVDDVRASPNIKRATFATWFGGKDPKHDKEFFGSFAVDPDTYFDVYSDMYVPPELLEAWKHDPQGAIVGDVLAKKMGWKVGDRVTLNSGIYTDKMDWEFRITAIYEAKARSVDRSSFMFQYDYLDRNVTQRMQNQIGWIVSRVTDPSRAADISVALDKVFDEKEIPTLSQDERAFNASFIASASAVLTAIDIVSVVILLIMMLILGNTIAMGVRERTNEYGVLKAIGFSSRQIAIFIVGESLLIGMIGGALGLLVSYPFVEQGMGRWIEENMGSFIPYFRIAPGISVAAILLSILVGLIAAAVPAYSASKLKVVDALRRVA